MDFKLNIPTTMTKRVSLEKGKLYDVIIIGGGPAAQTAAVYCMRKGLATGLITENFGGQVAETASVENYMGFNFIDGTDLVKKFQNQLEQFEAGILESTRAERIYDGKIKKVITGNGDEFIAKTLIITTGKTWRKLGVEGEKELTGKGVAYCSTCDAPLFAGKKVAVAGGGNSAVESAVDLAKIAERVTIIQLLPSLTADKVLIDQLNRYDNIDILFESEVVRINGSSRVESVEVLNKVSGKTTGIQVEGIFIEIGLIPENHIAGDLLKQNGTGEIIVDSMCRTNIEGIFAAGDVTSVPYKQIIIAAGEGAKAALSAAEYILKHSNTGTEE